MRPALAGRFALKRLTPAGEIAAGLDRRRQTGEA